MIVELGGLKIGHVYFSDYKITDPQSAPRIAAATLERTGKFWDIIPRSCCPAHFTGHYPRIIYSDFLGPVAVCECGAKSRSKAVTT